MPNKLKYIIQIDGLRCFAVIGVFISHYIIVEFDNEILKRIPFGTGVNLFFVISGYLITYILLNKKKEIEDKTTSVLKELKNFFLKRTLRIFPLYYMVIALLFFFNYNEIKDYAIYLITYTTNMYITFHNGYIDNKTHLWSLAVEEQFYLIWPFIIFFIKRKYLFSIILFMPVLSLVSKCYFFNSNFPIGVNAFLFCCFDSLGFGALLAYLQLYNVSFFESIINKKFLIILVLCYLAVFVFPNFSNQQTNSLFNNFFTSLIYFFVVGLAAQNKFTGVIKYMLENKVALYIGKISYGIYIIHNFVKALFFNFFARKLPPTSDQGVRIFYWIALTLLLASISWYLIEKPFLKLKKNIK